MNSSNLAPVLLCLILSVPCLAQPFNDSFILAHLNKKTYELDSNASAIVLFEKSVIRIEKGMLGWEQTQHTYCLVKIIRNSSNITNRDCNYNQTTDVKIHYYNPTNEAASNYTLDKITGTTYNLANGKIVRTELKNEDIYNRRINKYISEKGFLMPDVQDGSIVEYSFENTSPLYSMLPGWYFQSTAFPKLTSIYEIIYPKNIGYTYIAQGFTKFEDYNSEEDAEKNKSQGYHLISSVIGNYDNYSSWTRHNIPIFNDEPFTEDPVRHFQLIQVQINKFEDDNPGNYHILTDWTKLDKYLLENEKFGAHLKNGHFLHMLADSLTNGMTSNADKTKAIYQYLRNNFTSNGEETIYSNNSPKKIFGKKMGSEAEINFLLIILLREANINAYPLVLSTTGNLPEYKTYPILDRLNYVACATIVNGKQLLLDASDKYNPFGILPSACYNGYARIVDKNAGYGIDLDSNKLTEKTINLLDIKIDDKNNEDIKVTKQFGLTKSSELREDWINHPNAIKNYVNKDMQLLSSEVKISDISVKNINDIDDNLVLTYNVHINAVKQNKVFYLPTDFIKFYNTNPFTATHRTLPIEFANKIAAEYILNVHLPDKMKPQDLPQSVNIKLDEAMEFKHQIDYNKDMKLLSVKTDFRINQTMFSPHQYDDVKAFFEKMATEQNNLIALTNEN